MHRYKENLPSMPVVKIILVPIFIGSKESQGKLKEICPY